MGEVRGEKLTWGTARNYMNIDTVRLSHILETNELTNLNYFLSLIAFIVSHKSESFETLLGVLWYLPVNSPIIVVTNCPERRREEIEKGLTVTSFTRAFGDCQRPID